jgi:hypothetical protein
MRRSHDCCSEGNGIMFDWIDWPALIVVVVVGAIFEAYWKFTGRGYRRRFSRAEQETQVYPDEWGFWKETSDR